MTTDHLEKQLEELVVRVRDRIQIRLSEDDGKQCELCGIIEHRIDRVENKSAWEVYTTDCGQCDRSIFVTHLYVEIGGEFAQTQRKIRASDCGCSCSENELFELVREDEPVERSEYHLPIKGMLQTMIHEHHVSYVPERTIRVCSDCHSKIHHDEDFRPDLKPEMSREEWKAVK